MENLLEDNLKELNIIKEKYVTGNYICVVENRFGPEGYFIKEDNSEFKHNWNYTLINKKHSEVLEAYLKDSNIEIFTDAYSDYAHEYYKMSEYFSNQNFIEFYNENYNFKI